MKNISILPITLMLLILGATALPLKADEMNDLISTVIQASPEVKKSARSYNHSNAPSEKKKVSQTGGHNDIPNLNIPDSEVLEASSKFPRNYIGKYVYGEVTKGYGSTTEDTKGAALIGFWAKNMRCFYLETKDPEVIAKMEQYPLHTKFIIPRECPLKIVQKCGFNYILHLPFESQTTPTQ